jgi:glycosyltransferase involved in cell wall biosynthesis
MRTIARLAIISTHPIQYYAPIFRALAESGLVEPRVFFTWPQITEGKVIDAGFGRSVEWDIPLTEGYEFEFVPNVAHRPGNARFAGMVNPKLIPAIERWGADAVLVFGWNFYSHLQAMRHFRGRLPVFFRGDSHLLNNQSDLKTRLRHTLLRWVYSHVDVAICVGSNNRDYYRWCGVPAERIGFAPHAVDTTRFDDSDGWHFAKAAEQRRILKIGPDETVLLYAGKFIPEKDLGLLIQAFLAACDRSPARPAGHLVLLGNGPLQGELEALCPNRSNIHFLPFQNQQAMPAVYRLGSAFVLPSRSETWGLGLNEALASGRPIIASTRVGACRDLVKEGVTGWSFESGNLKHLTTVVSGVLASPVGRLRQMQAAARAEGQRWSTDSAAQGIARTVLDFAAGRSLATDSVVRARDGGAEHAAQ